MRRSVLSSCVEERRVTDMRERRPLHNGLIQTHSTPLFLCFFPSPLLSFLSPSITSSPPSHLSISQTVVHLPPCAAAPICSLLTWPFTSDPIPTILIETKSHYGGLLFLLVCLHECVCVFVCTMCAFVIGCVYLHMGHTAV